jgi:hypothetical protein
VTDGRLQPDPESAWSPFFVGGYLDPAYQRLHLHL